MITNRIIACLDIKDGRTVKGTNFVSIRDAGNPLELAIKYEQEGADELVFLDITATERKTELLTDLVSRLSRELSIPFTVGGGINSVENAYSILRNGADKVAINSAAVYRPELLKELSDVFGSQCIVLAIDAKLIEREWRVFTHGGRKETEYNLFEWVQKGQSLGAGEILFTSMNHDGTKIGFAYEALKKLNDVLDIPVIASGGAGKIEHFEKVFKIAKVDAALAASVFHFQEISIPFLKEKLANVNLNMRIIK